MKVRVSVSRENRRALRILRRDAPRLVILLDIAVILHRSELLICEQLAERTRSLKRNSLERAKCKEPVDVVRRNFCARCKLLQARDDGRCKHVEPLIAFACPVLGIRTVVVQGIVVCFRYNHVDCRVDVVLARSCETCGNESLAIRPCCVLANVFAVVLTYRPIASCGYHAGNPCSPDEGYVVLGHEVTVSAKRGFAGLE